ncbi:MAG: hypothetical protein HFG27_12225 [Provencibacterium sp.]|nr:hypothetical protein [Provencibacterium sp.]
MEYKENASCQAGMIGDVQVNFVHYSSFDEAREK